MDTQLLQVSVRMTQIIIVGYAAAMIFLIVKQARLKTFVMATTAAVALCYAVIAWPLQRMWWGNVGDENLILAFITQVRMGNPFADFYYGWLPPFYPPLYFWIVGSLGRVLSVSSIDAAKIGVALTLIAWFAVPYRAMRRAMHEHHASAHELPLTWFSLIVPIAMLVMLDMSAIVTKPYEALSAMFAILWCGIFAQQLRREEWSIREYVVAGISAGVLILLFYFWWIILIPALTIVIFGARSRKRSFKRFFIVGCIALAIAAPYWIPFSLSLVRYGIENWQARFFVLSDLDVFWPWTVTSLRGWVYLMGLAGLVLGYRRMIMVRVAATTLACCYIYQFVNFLRYTFHTYPIQASKPFLFLGTACIAIGVAYSAIYIHDTLVARCSLRVQRGIVMLLFLIITPLMPYASFASDAEQHKQFIYDLVPPPQASIAQAVVNYVPDWRSRTWLASSVPEMAPYLPLSYFIGYSPHFSHQASQYSWRKNQIYALSSAHSPDEFMRIVEQGTPHAIDAMLLYYDPKTVSYVLYFWKDAYPNGGIDEEVRISASLISTASWSRVYDKDQWSIWVRK